MHFHCYGGEHKNIELNEEIRPQVNTVAQQEEVEEVKEEKPLRSVIGDAKPYDKVVDKVDRG